MTLQEESSEPHRSKQKTRTLQKRLAAIDSQLNALEQRYPNWRSWVFGSAYGDTPPEWFRGMAKMRRERSAITAELARRGKLQAADREASATKNADTVGGESTNRRAMIEAFLVAVLEETGRRITKKHIWTVAGYSDATEFERFQRNDRRATDGATANFNRVLSGSPADFIRTLERIVAQQKKK